MRPSKQVTTTTTNTSTTTNTTIVNTPARINGV